ncbi:hypothetical protein [Rhizobium sp. CCGE 510]|uniref:hypothetical protein n=1 Tax=Rhizobium sp. CCGE 510 TaxID=1132836 RepID=UPI00031CD2B5|nr:hypothetical protein [Rhizobium sp. CCGE 510]
MRCIKRFEAGPDAANEILNPSHMAAREAGSFREACVAALFQDAGLGGRLPRCGAISDLMLSETVSKARKIDISALSPREIT